MDQLPSLWTTVSQSYYLLRGYTLAADLLLQLGCRAEASTETLQAFY